MKMELRMELQQRKREWKLPLSAEERHALYTAIAHFVTQQIDPWQKAKGKRHSEVFLHLQNLEQRLEQIEEESDR